MTTASTHHVDRPYPLIPDTPHRWVRTGHSYLVQLGYTIHQHQANALPATVVVHRQDGTASRHRVTGLVRPGNNPLVSVDPRHLQPAPNLPAPTRPEFTWKHSKKRSCLVRQDPHRANAHHATVHRTRRHGSTLWTFTLRDPATRATTHQGAVPAQTRAQALRDCEDTLTKLATA